MNEDDKPEASLADQAANWVPPWARPKPEPQAQSFPELQWQSDPEDDPVVPDAEEELAVPAAGDEPAVPDAEDQPVIPVAEEQLAVLIAEEEPAAPVVEEEPVEPAAPVVEESVPEEPVAEGEPVVEEEPAPVDAVAEDESVVEEEPAPVEAVAEDEPVVEDEPAAVDEVADVAPAGDVEALPGLVVVPTEAAESVPAEMGDAELRAAVEAILLVVDEPTSEVTLAQVLDQPVDRVVVALEAASAQYTRMGFGFDLRRVAGGWRLYTRPEYAAYVEKFVLDGQQIRLTQAALETLAVIAYKQPVTRSRISAIRGVNCDGVVRTLVMRGLIEEIGSEPESGAFLYRTTTLFLEKLGLDSVDQLPPLAPFLPDDIDEIADAQR